jgi:hypothetical protein
MEVFYLSPKTPIDQHGNFMEKSGADEKQQNLNLED